MPLALNDSLPQKKLSPFQRPRCHCHWQNLVAGACPQQCWHWWWQGCEVGSTAGDRTCRAHCVDGGATSLGWLHRASCGDMTRKEMSGQAALWLVPWLSKLMQVLTTGSYLVALSLLEGSDRLVPAAEGPPEQGSQAT